MSHAIHHLAPKGRAGIVMPRGTLTSAQGGDDSIRRAFIEDDIVECVIDLPGQLFFNTQIPSSLWFFNKNKGIWKSNRNNQVLFIDARKLGSPISRTQIEFSDEEINLIKNTFNSWCDGTLKEIDGFCKSVTIEEIASNGYSLAPGRYIDAEDVNSEEDGQFDIRMEKLTELLAEQIKESHKLERVIASQLKALGYDNL
jgi:type I restriction enzyme M protein